MLVIRPITEKDLNVLEEIAMSATLGITSLPKNRDRLERRLIKSVESFKKSLKEPRDELYLFLLEETETKKVGGITGILSKTGVDEPAYFLQLDIARYPDINVLRPIAYIDGPSEICSLYLMRAFRQGGLGRLLSLCRFLFMASHPHRFEAKTIAELRGYIRPDGKSPFWSAIGEHFINMSFVEAMTKRDQGTFVVGEIIPEFPIYYSMLPRTAQSAAGKIHSNTKPALKMLKEQGFQLTNEFDLFDGGPKIEAVTADIKAIRLSVEIIVGHVVPTLDHGMNAIIGTTDINFRACQALISKGRDGKATISKETALGLEVDTGDKIRYYDLGKI